MFDRLPRGANWVDALYRPHWVAKLRRRERERAQGPGFTKKQFAALLKKYDERCLCCRRKHQRMVPDHVIPISEGGADHIRNIQPLCYECNLAKGTDATDYRPRDVRAWLRDCRGQCVSRIDGRRCKNLAAPDSELRLCHVHQRRYDHQWDVHLKRRRDGWHLLEWDRLLRNDAPVFRTQAEAEAFVRKEWPGEPVHFVIVTKESGQVTPPQHPEPPRSPR